MKESSLKNFDIEIDKLLPNDDNVNEMDEAKFKRLMKEIQEEGFLSPLTVIPFESRYIILQGEHRWKAAKALGMTYVPCVILEDERWKDKVKIDLQSFKFNNLHGSSNKPKYHKLIDRLSKQMNADQIQEALGYTQFEEWKSDVSSSVEQYLKTVKAPKAALSEVRLAKRECKTPEALEKKIAAILNDLAQNKFKDGVTEKKEFCPTCGQRIKKQDSNASMQESCNSEEASVQSELST